MPRKTTYKDRLSRIKDLRDAKKPLKPSDVVITVYGEEDQPVNFLSWFRDQLDKVPDKVVPVRGKASTALPPGAIALRDPLDTSTSAQVLVDQNGMPIYAIIPTAPMQPPPKKRAMPWDRETTARDRPWN